MTKNVGEAVLILGLTWIGFNYGFTWWINALILLCVFSWGYYGLSDERKEYLESLTRLNRAKANYYDRTRRDE